MARQTEKPKDLNAAVIEMRKELASTIAAHAQSLGENRTAIPVFRFTVEATLRLAFWPPTNPASPFSYRDENASTSEALSTTATDRPFFCRRSMFLLKVKSSKPRSKSPCSRCFSD